jgi:hypothetical protein
MTGWRKWNLRDWNEEMLAHFFRRRDEQSSPVVVLLVTADELARTTRDAGSNADEVRNAFVDVVRAAIRHSGSLLEDASNYEAWPGPPRSESIPRFIAHLLFMCIAASESSDNLGDEGSFVSRLRELSDDQLPDSSLQMLPQLWEHLASWLVANEEKYRRLHLPRPGIFTRIGYTIKLAFPDRRDQRQLSDLLDRAALSGHEPPVGRVLSLVAGERSRFRPSFVSAFDEFRRIYETSSLHIAPRLVEHRFWAAVREASLRGRGQTGVIDLSVRVSLLCEEQDDRLALFVAAEERGESRDCAFVELPVRYGEWRFALVPSGVETIEPEQLDKITRAVLASDLRLPRVSSHVEQGVLPFVLSPHGLMELASHDQLFEVTAVLVRERLLPDFLRFFGEGASTRTSSYAGWVQVHDPVLRAVPCEELDGSTLSRVWSLQKSLVPITIRIAGGIRADDGWLGAQEVLPHVIAPGASSVVLEGAEGRDVLLERDSDVWRLPCRDITRDFVLLASHEGDAQERRALRFHATPATEKFKAASEPDAWIVEGLGGTGTLSSSLPFTTVGKSTTTKTPLSEWPTLERTSASSSAIPRTRSGKSRTSMESF